MLPADPLRIERRVERLGLAPAAPGRVHRVDLEGAIAVGTIAAYIVPLDIIGTDPERLLANNEAVQEAGRDSFFGYPPTKDTAQDCGPQNGSTCARRAASSAISRRRSTASGRRRPTCTTARCRTCGRC